MKLVNGRMQVAERAVAPVLNPLRVDPSQPLESVSVADVSLGQVRTIYTMIRAINSSRLTRNYTFYTRASLTGKDQGTESTGFYSYVRPWGKPVIREHNLQAEQGLFGPVGEADVPMGRIVYSTYVRRASTEVQTPHPKATLGYPGSVEGDGYLMVVAAITEESAINRVLGGIYHTVSIGADVESVVESISGVDLVKAYKNGDDLPEYRRGQEYEGQLSYWKMGLIRGRELSYVNAPSDELAGTITPDIGEYGMQLLLGQKKVGSKEFSMYDARTLEKVLDHQQEGAWDTSYEFVDSVQYQPDTVLVPAGVGGYMAMEKVQTSISPEAGTGTGSSSEEQNTMNKIMEGIKADAPTLENLQAVAAALADETALELADDSWTALRGLLPAECVQELTALVQGESQLIFSDELAMQNATDRAAELLGEFNENGAALALVLYLAQEHTARPPQDESQPCTLGDVFGEQAGELKDKALGLSLGEFRALGDAVKMTEEWEQLSLYFKNKEATLGIAALSFTYPAESSDEVMWLPDNVFEGAVMQAPEDLERLDGLAESWSYDEQSLASNKAVVTAMREALPADHVLWGLWAAWKGEKLNEYDWTQIKFETKRVGSLSIGVEFFVRKYFANEASIGTREYLAPLVGIVRKLNVDKATFEAARKAYSYLGSSVLRTYLASIPESAPQSAAQTQASNQPNNPIQVLPGVAAAQEDLSDTGTQQSSTEAQPRPKLLSKYRVDNKPKRAAKK